MRHRIFTALALLSAAILGGCVVYPPYAGYRPYPAYAYRYGPGYYGAYPGGYAYRYRPFYSPDYNGTFNPYPANSGGHG